MSWDIWLTCDSCGHEVHADNYTHNTNDMIRAAAEAAGVEADIWPYNFHMSGPEGGAWFNAVIKELERDPDLYQAMDPRNRWGSYDSLLPVLRELRAAVPEFPTTWGIYG